MADSERCSSDSAALRRTVIEQEEEEEEEDIELLLLNQLTHLDLVHCQRIVHTCYRCLLLWIPIAQVYWTE